MSRVSTNSSPAQATPPTAEERLLRYKRELHQRLISAMDMSAISRLSEEELRREVRKAAEEQCRHSPDLLSLSERERLVNEVLDETFGLGPLERLMKDGTISDILINGPKTVYIERRGLLERTDIAFNDDKHLLQIIQRIVSRVGRRVDETTPMVDARLPDGSRVNAIIPPLALDGPLLSIRRFGARPLQVADLLANHAVTPEMIQFLSACTKARINMLISGGTGSGKTTLLNALSAFIPAHERVATIEDSAELKLQQPHVVRLETRPPNIEGTGQVTTRDLVRNALRMRPDRIVIGECRGDEALDMLQAMNTGHEGSMTTIHANDTRDALSRLEMMVGMGGFELPMWIIRRQIVSAIQVVIQTARLTGGARKVIKISEVTGMEEDVISMHDMFVFTQTGVDSEGHAQGLFQATGIRPRCMDRLAAAGIRLPVEMFERRTLYPGQGDEIMKEIAPSPLTASLSFPGIQKKG
jgi:pilus assembly protein CpaF